MVYQDRAGVFANCDPANTWTGPRDEALPDQDVGEAPDDEASEPCSEKGEDSDVDDHTDDAGDECAHHDAIAGTGQDGGGYEWEESDRGRQRAGRPGRADRDWPPSHRTKP